MRGTVVLLVLTGSAVGLGSGCKLGEADVVGRTPSVPRAQGGVAGQSTASTQPFDAAPERDAAMEGADIADAVQDPRRRSEVAEAFAHEPDVAGASRDSDVDRAPCTSGAFVFCDTFEHGANQWTILDGTWVITALNPEGTSHALGTANRLSSQTWVPSAGWRDMTVHARVLVGQTVPPSSANRAELFARYVDASHNYAVALRADGYLALRKNGTGLGNPVKMAPLDYQWHSLTIRVSRSLEATIVEGYLDDTLVLVEPDTAADATVRGTVAVGVYGAMEALFDDVRVSVP